MEQGFVEMVAGEMKAAAEKVLTGIEVSADTSEFIAEDDLVLLNDALVAAERVVDLLVEAGEESVERDDIVATLAMMKGRYGPWPYKGKHIPRDRAKYKVGLDLYVTGQRIAARAPAVV